MIVNWHAHIYPPDLIAGSWRADSPMRLENMLAIHDRAGVDKVVVSNTIHTVKDMSEADALRFIQGWNEYAAEVEQRHPDRCIGFASTIPGGGPDYLRELERAVRDYKLHGVLINSSHHGRYPDEDNARGFWELVTALDVPVFVHAPSSSFGEEVMQMYRLISSVGRPFDECLSLARLIVRGVFEQFPTLKLVAAHCGSGICEVIGRMDYAYELREEAAFLGPYEPMLISRKPSDYLSRMWVDSVSYYLPALKLAVDALGVDRVLFGADAPPLAPLLPRAIEIVRDLPISEGDKDKILGQNALNLLGLT
jgi:predicted TIM-barrel fold metal-dependent hydrolase